MKRPWVVVVGALALAPGRSVTASEEVARVDLVGALRRPATDSVEPGSRTVVTVRDMAFELEFGGRDDLRSSAEKLEGKVARVRGTLHRRKTARGAARWVVEVDGLEPGEADKVGETLTKEHLRKLIPRASGIDKEVAGRIARSPTAPTLDDFESQPLSAILLTLRPRDSAGERAQFQYVGGIPKPSRLFGEIGRSARLGPVKLDSPYVTFLHDDRITDVTLRVVGAEARGTVRFEAPELYSGKADFVARLEGDRWEIEEFSLPAYGLKTVKADDGTWKVEKLSGEPKPARRPETE